MVCIIISIRVLLMVRDRVRASLSDKVKFSGYT